MCGLCLLGCKFLKLSKWLWTVSVFRNKYSLLPLQWLMLSPEKSKYLHPLTSLFIFCRFLVCPKEIVHCSDRIYYKGQEYEGNLMKETFSVVYRLNSARISQKWWDFSKLQLGELKQYHVAKSRILFLMFMPVCLLWPKRVVKCSTSGVGEDRVGDWGTCSHSLVSSDFFVKSQETALASPVYTVITARTGYHLKRQKIRIHQTGTELLEIGQVCQRGTNTLHERSQSWY